MKNLLIIFVFSVLTLPVLAQNSAFVEGGLNSEGGLTINVSTVPAQHINPLPTQMYVASDYTGGWSNPTISADLASGMYVFELSGDQRNNIVQGGGRFRFNLVQKGENWMDLDPHANDPAICADASGSYGFELILDSDGSLVDGCPDQTSSGGGSTDSGDLVLPQDSSWIAFEHDNWVYLNPRHMPGQPEKLRIAANFNGWVEHNDDKLSFMKVNLTLANGETAVLYRIKGTDPTVRQAFLTAGAAGECLPFNAVANGNWYSFGNHYRDRWLFATMAPEQQRKIFVREPDISLGIKYFTDGTFTVDCGQALDLADPDIELPTELPDGIWFNGRVSGTNTLVINGDFVRGDKPETLALATNFNSWQDHDVFPYLFYKHEVNGHVVYAMDVNDYVQATFLQSAEIGECVPFNARNGDQWVNIGDVVNSASLWPQVPEAQQAKAWKRDDGLSFGIKILDDGFDTSCGAGTITTDMENLEVPSKYALEQNYPNPFNPVTTISYSLASTEQVQLEVYDVIGRVMAVLVDSVQSAGKYEVQFNADGLSSGLYVYRLKAGEFVDAKAMMLQR